MKTVGCFHGLLAGLGVHTVHTWSNVRGWGAGVSTEYEWEMRRMTEADAKADAAAAVVHKLSGAEEVELAVQKAWELVAAENAKRGPSYHLRLSADASLAGMR